MVIIITIINRFSYWNFTLGVKDMSIRKVDLHFTKASKSIIIFNKARGNKLKVSRIVLHTAFTLVHSSYFIF